MNQVCENYALYSGIGLANKIRRKTDIICWQPISRFCPEENEAPNHLTY